MARALRLVRERHEGRPDQLAAETDGRICVRPLPVDGLPIVGWLPTLPNAYLMVTHSGMTLGALLGRLATAELLGARQPVLDPYRPERFPPGQPAG